MDSCRKSRETEDHLKQNTGTNAWKQFFMVAEGLLHTLQGLTVATRAPVHTQAILVLFLFSVYSLAQDHSMYVERAFSLPSPHLFPTIKQPWEPLFILLRNVCVMKSTFKSFPEEQPADPQGHFRSWKWSRVEFFPHRIWLMPTWETRNSQHMCDPQSLWWPQGLCNMWISSLGEKSNIVYSCS